MSEITATIASVPHAPAGGFAAISKYNPHLWSAEQLRAIFVARQNELADLLRTLRTTPPDTVGQHALLVGARGMGKSTLMQRLALAVEDDAELSRAWLALRFPEEQYTVSTVGQFWANVLDSLVDALERRGQATLALDATAQRIAALPTGEQVAACLAAIDRCADENGQRLLLLVDNTDLLLHNIGREAQWALRETLQSDPRLLWVGGSYQSLEADSDYHDAFLDFFRVVELRPLRLPEMQQALLALAETFGGGEAREAMQKQLAAHPERLPTLRQLSGGNPRTTVMLYELFANGQKSDVRGDLETLLDAMTPLYKARMDSLADLPRKLLAHILEHWAPIALRELADASQVAKGSISPQLQRLELEGLIEKTSLHGTTRNGYQVAERFFNIWYLMRFSPRRQRARLAWLVEFMRLWFSTDELCGLARQRMGGFCTSLRSAHDWEYDRALTDVLPPETGERHTLRWSLLKELKDNRAQLNDIFDLDGEDRDFKDAADYLQRLAELPARLRLCPHAETEQEKKQWVEAVLGSVILGLVGKELVARVAAGLSRLQFDELQKKLSEESLTLEQRIGSAGAHALRAAVLSHDFFPDMPDSRLAYDQIRACFSQQPEALRFACDLFYLKAQELAQKAPPGDAGLAFNPAWLTDERLGRYEEAEAAYRQAIALDEKYARPWNGLGNLLQVRLGRYEEAEAAYRQAIALDEKYARPWNGLGNLLQDHLGRYEEAEAAYRQAIALDETDAYPWNGLGNLLQNRLSRYEEAEAAYRQAIALDETDAYPWNGLGNLLQDHLGRYEEAEAAYRQAIALDETDAAPWNGLGNLLQDHLGRYEEVEAAYQQAIVRDERNTHSKANLARLWWRQGRRQEAESLCRELAKMAKADEWHLLLQAHLCLDNRQLALDALQALALAAQKGEQLAFYRLKEQVWECHELGLGQRLADWMAGSEQAVFLLPFIQALYTLAGAEAKLQDLPLETQQMADEIVRIGRQRAARGFAASAAVTSASPPQGGKGRRRKIRL